MNLTRKASESVLRKVFPTVLPMVSSFNPLPNGPILDSSSSTAIKDMMSKMWTNGDTDI